jgi:hypothetical protein
MAKIEVLCRVMAFNASFNNISIMVEETGVPGENHGPASSRRQTLSQYFYYEGFSSRNTLISSIHLKTNDSNGKPYNGGKPQALVSLKKYMPPLFLTSR